MPTAQGRSATTRPFFVLSNAAGHMPPNTKDDHKTEPQCNKLPAAYADKSPKRLGVFIRPKTFRLSSTNWINWDGGNSSLKKSSHSMGRCHVLWCFYFYFLSLSFYWSSALSISSFRCLSQCSSLGQTSHNFYDFLFIFWSWITSNIWKLYVENPQMGITVFHFWNDIYNFWNSFTDHYLIIFYFVI